VLRKRKAFRKAFAGFDPKRVARFTAADRRRLLADAGIIRNRLKIDAVIENARRILELRRSHGSFAAWLDAHHPRSRDAWVRLFRETFRFTGGEIVGEFLMSTGYLPGAHRPGCPVAARIAKAKPPWAAVARRAGRRAVSRPKA
jgi:DNA-3-methyladenine glycosylase I